MNEVVFLHCCSGTFTFTWVKDLKTSTRHAGRYPMLDYPTPQNCRIRFCVCQLVYATFGVDKLIETEPHDLFSTIEAQSTSFTEREREKENDQVKINKLTICECRKSKDFVDCSWLISTILMMLCFLESETWLTSINLHITKKRR